MTREEQPKQPAENIQSQLSDLYPHHCISLLCIYFQDAETEKGNIYAVDPVTQKRYRLLYQDKKMWFKNEEEKITYELVCFPPEGPKSFKRRLVLTESSAKLVKECGEKDSKRIQKETKERAKRTWSFNVPISHEARKPEHKEHAKLLTDLEKQYPERLKTGAYFDLYDQNNPVIQGIDNRTYKAPTWEEIKAAITHDQLDTVKKHLREPLLLLVPIGLPLKLIAVKIGLKTGKLLSHSKPHIDFNIKSDLKDDLIYCPRNFNRVYQGGFTKQELIHSNTPINKFKGWQVLIADGSLEVLSGTLNRSADELFDELKEKGLDGMAPEEWLILHAEGLRQGNIREVYNGTWLLGSYINRLDRIPQASWNRGSSQALIHFDDLTASYPDLGLRWVLRI